MAASDRMIVAQVKDGRLVPEPEMPGLNSMRTLFDTPLLSGKWLSRRELPQVLVEQLPPMMKGADFADAQSEDEDEGVRSCLFDVRIWSFVCIWCGWDMLGCC